MCFGFYRFNLQIVNFEAFQFLGFSFQNLAQNRFGNSLVQIPPLSFPFHGGLYTKMTFNISRVFSSKKNPYLFGFNGDYDYD